MVVPEGGAELRQLGGRGGTQHSIDRGLLGCGAEHFGGLALGCGRRQLGEQLVGADPDRDRQLGLGRDCRPQLVGQPHGGGVAVTAAHLDEAFVDRGPLEGPVGPDHSTYHLHGSRDEKGGGGG